MNYRFFFICWFLIFTSCNEDDSEEKKAVRKEEDLGCSKQFLRERVRISLDEEKQKYDYIVTSVYQGEVVYIVVNCNSVKKSTLEVKDCMGNSVGVIGLEEGDVPESVLSEGEIYYKHESSRCFE
ncbi:hypothetical protein [Wenyingzhuangia sp. IMCC45574]